MKALMKNEKGFALLSIVILTWLLFTMVTTYTAILVQEKLSIHSSENSLKVESIAEAALEEILWEYNYGGADFTTNGWLAAGATTSKTENSFTNSSGTAIGSYTATVSNYLTTSPEVTITATYTAQGHGTTATLHAKLQPRPLFDSAMLSKDVITLTGNAFTDSYNSSLGAYNADLGGGVYNIGSDADVRTNLTNTANAINLNAANGNPAIKGDAGTGSGSTVSHSSKVSGAVTSTVDETISDNSVPAAMTGLASGGTLSSTVIPMGPGDYKYDAISIAGNNEVEVSGAGTTRIWVTGNVSTAGSSTLELQSGGTLIMYVGGTVSAGGTGISNLNGTQYPGRMQIYGLSTCASVSISGSANFVGLISTPSANVTLSGSSGYYGALVGNQLTATGGGGVHYDAQAITASTSGYEIEWVRRTA